MGSANIQVEHQRIAVALLIPSWCCDVEVRQKVDDVGKYTVTALNGERRSEGGKATTQFVTHLRHAEHPESCSSSLLVY